MTTTSHETLEFLRKNKLFAGFSEQQLSLVVPLVQEVKLATGEFIIHENDVFDYFYIVKSGAIEICRFDQEVGRYHSLSILKKDEILGEIAILDRKFRSASARAVEPSILYQLSIDRLKIISSNEQVDFSLIGLEPANGNNTLIFPLLIYNLARLIGTKVRDTNEITLMSIRKELKHNKERFYLSLIAIGILVAALIFVLS